MATAKKKASTLKRKGGPDMSKTKVTRATGSVEWRNKTVAEEEIGPNRTWRAQLSVCSDGRKLRSVKQLIRKRDGTEHHINGFMTENDPTGKELKAIIKLLLIVLPKTADVSDIVKAVLKAKKERE